MPAVTYTFSQQVFTERAPMCPTLFVLVLGYPSSHEADNLVRNDTSNKCRAWRQRVMGQEHSIRRGQGRLCDVTSEQRRGGRE